MARQRRQTQAHTPDDGAGNAAGPRRRRKQLGTVAAVRNALAVLGAMVVVVGVIAAAQLWRDSRRRPRTDADRLASICRAQYDYARQQGWLAHFDDAARRTGIPVETLLAVASRETNLRNVSGDKGNGRGIMQVDVRWHPDFVATGAADDPRRNILYGAQHLADLRDQIRTMVGRTNRLNAPDGRPRPFFGAPMTDAQLQAVSVAAYNCGLNAYYHFSTTGDPDRGTTPGPYAQVDASGKRRGDYSQDVSARAAHFAALRSIRRLPVDPHLSPDGR